MPITLRNLEWPNHNSQRKYPLALSASLRDTSGSFVLPSDFIIGLILPVSWAIEADPAGFHIASLVIYSAGYQIKVGYTSGDDTTIVASALIPKSSHVENAAYPLIGTGAFHDSRGWISIGSLDTIGRRSAGEFTFDLDGGRLEVDCIRPNIRAVTAIQVQNGSALSAEFAGTIRLRAGRNTRFRVEQSPGEAPVVIWDAIDGAGLTSVCVCEDNLAPPLRTINGFSSPDSNVRLVGDACIEISGGQNGISVKNTCAEPCCGCKELEAITQTAEALASRASTLENFIMQLETAQTQMDKVVLGSKFGDRGCATAADCN